MAPLFPGHPQLWPWCPGLGRWLLPGLSSRVAEGPLWWRRRCCVSHAGGARDPLPTSSHTWLFHTEPPVASWGLGLKGTSMGTSRSPPPGLTPFIRAFTQQTLAGPRPGMVPDPAPLQGLEPGCAPGVTDAAPQTRDLVVFTKAHLPPGARAQRSRRASRTVSLPPGRLTSRGPPGAEDRREVEATPRPRPKPKPSRLRPPWAPWGCTGQGRVLGVHAAADVPLTPCPLWSPQRYSPPLGAGPGHAGWGKEEAPDPAGSGRPSRAPCRTGACDRAAGGGEPMGGDVGDGSLEGPSRSVSLGESPDGQVRQAVQDGVEGDEELLRATGLWLGGRQLVLEGPQRLICRERDSTGVSTAHGGRAPGPSRAPGTRWVRGPLTAPDAALNTDPATCPSLGRRGPPVPSRPSPTLSVRRPESSTSSGPPPATSWLPPPTGGRGLHGNHGSAPSFWRTSSWDNRARRPRLPLLLSPKRPGSSARHCLFLDALCLRAPADTRPSLIHSFNKHLLFATVDRVTFCVVCLQTPL